MSARSRSRSLGVESPPSPGLTARTDGVDRVASRRVDVDATAPPSGDVVCGPMRTQWTFARLWCDWARRRARASSPHSDARLPYEYVESRDPVREVARARSLPRMCQDELEFLIRPLPPRAAGPTPDEREFLTDV